VDRSDSHIEIKGFTARHYDLLMDLLTLGLYGKFIKNALKAMDIKRGDRILDLGAGTGRNACLMREYLGDTGEIVALEIGEEMIRQFREKCAGFSNVLLLEQRIEEPLPFKEEFDKALLSFVFHGFVQEDRLKILRNVYRALKPGGKLFILDYNEIENFRDTPFYVKLFFEQFECPLAIDFVSRKWGEILKDEGFEVTREVLFLRNYLRLLEATKR